MVTAIVCSRGAGCRTVRFPDRTENPMTDTRTPALRRDPDAVRRRILALPADAQAALKKIWPAGVSLLDPAVTDTHLDQIDQLINTLTPAPAGAAGASDTGAAEPEELADTASVTACVEVARGLPTDLYRQLTARMDNERIPRSTQITPAQLAVLSMWVGDYAVEADQRRQQVMARAAETGLTDDARHALIYKVTGGRTQSSKALTAAETRQVCDAMTAADLGVGVPGSDAPIDGKAEAARLGVTQAALLRTAAKIARDLGVDPPKKLADIHVGSDLARRLLETAPHTPGDDTPVDDTPGAAAGSKKAALDALTAAEAALKAARACLELVA